jgi:hypothetical protein
MEDNIFGIIEQLAKHDISKKEAVERIFSLFSVKLSLPDISEVESQADLHIDRYPIMNKVSKKDEKAFAIHSVNNSTLLEVFEDAVCDRNYNPTSDNYNKSGYTYRELKSEILDRLQSERA